jgi:GAF domain-containing protein
VAQQAGRAGDLLIDPRSARPDRRVDLYLMLAATFVAVVVYLAALRVHAVPPKGLSVAFFVAAPTCATFAVVLLGTRGRAEHDGRLAWMSAGIGVGVVAMVLQIVSFPVAAPGGGVLGTSDQSSAALYLVFHLALAGGALAGALAAPVRWRIPAALAATFLVVLLAADLVPLPELLTGRVMSTSRFIGLEITTAVVTAVAAVVWVLRVGRSAAVFHGWVGVALSLSVYDLILNALAAQRYTPVWWASLSLRVFTYLVLAFGLLVALLSRLRDAESYSEAELDRRETQLRDSLSVTAGLLSSAEQLSRAVTPEEVGDVLSASARAVSGATHASVVLGRRGEHLRLGGADGYDAVLRRQLMLIDWDLLLPAPYVLSVGEPLFIENREEIHERFPKVAGLPMERAAAMAALPIKLGGEPIGVLSAWDVVPRQWTRNEKRVLAGLSAQGGQAVARARAYEEQAHAARTLQASLLPSRLPRPARLDVAARYVPAEDNLLVGGDWYDCLVLDEDRVALVVGDVMGKGLHAAALMGQIRMAVRSVAALDPAPSAALRALDDLNLELGDDEIVTMLYVLVDQARGVARVARAGHLPPALVHPEGKVELVELGGSAPLGVPDVERTEVEVGLPQGSVLVLYTDGLVEDRATGLDRGMSELTRYLEDVAVFTLPTGELATGLLEVCTSERPADDIALLVARYT